jgi:pseudaminic acid synthase
MTLDVDADGFNITDDKSLWKGKSLFKLYQEAYTPWEWHAPIFERARSLGMIPFSTPFDRTAVDFLESLGVEIYKIASFENTDIPLIEYVASKGKPVIISLGMATLTEADEAVSAARRLGCEELVLLKCTSTYPASPENSNILTIPHLRETFDCEVGLSDHTMGVGVAVASVALGATVIEKHFTLRRADGGVDSAFSLEPDELSALVVETRRAWESLGTISYGPSEAENASLKFRRSLYITEDLPEGAVLTERNVRAVRPGLGLPPKHYNLVLGKRVVTAVKRGTPVSWDLLMT